MSFAPLTRWELRCDGTTTTGLCANHWLVCADEEADPQDPNAWTPALFDQPVLDPVDHRHLHDAGWLVLRDGRVLCADHVSGLAFLAHAALEGLPFDEDDPEDPEDPGDPHPDLRDIEGHGDRQGEHR